MNRYLLICLISLSIWLPQPSFLSQFESQSQRLEAKQKKRNYAKDIDAILEIMEHQNNYILRLEKRISKLEKKDG